MRLAEKSVMLQVLDQTWKDHLLTLDHLRQGITCAATASATRSTSTSASVRLFEDMSRFARTW
jgi:preprotein translocase subunit SecA